MYRQVRSALGGWNRSFGSLTKSPRRDRKVGLRVVGTDRRVDRPEVLGVSSAGPSSVEGFGMVEGSRRGSSPACGATDVSVGGRSDGAAGARASSPKAGAKARPGGQP